VQEEAVIAGVVLLIAAIALMLGLAKLDQDGRWVTQHLPHEVMRLRIKAGVEVYTRESLNKGVPYRVVVEGTNGTLYESGGAWYGAYLDAVYIDRKGQYPRHEGLLLDGQPAVVCEEDRPNHRYTFAYSGTGRHMSIKLALPLGHTETSSSYSEGPVKVTIRTLNPKEAAEVRAMEAEQQRKAQEVHRAELNRRALELAKVAYMEQHLLDLNQQQRFAAKHLAEILTTWRYTWRKELFALRADGPFYTFIQEHYPQVLEFFEEARFKVIEIAEHMEDAPAPEPKHKETPEEWRKRTLGNKRGKVAYHKAELLQNMQMLHDFVEELDSYDIDEDERERLIQEFKERLLGGEEDSSNGFRQL